MRAKIEIEFFEVSGEKVTEKMSKSRNFKASTKKTVAELCKQIERYFKDFNINVKTNYKIE